jgi:hypothetical protein
MYAMLRTPQAYLMVAVATMLSTPAGICADASQMAALRIKSGAKRPPEPDMPLNMATTRFRAQAFMIIYQCFELFVAAGVYYHINNRNFSYLSMTCHRNCRTNRQSATVISSLAI